MTLPIDKKQPASQLEHMIGAMQCYAPNPCGDGHLCIHHQIAQYALQSAKTQHPDTARLNYLDNQSGIIAAVLGPGWRERFPQTAGAQNLREAIDAMLSRYVGGEK